MDRGLRRETRGRRSEKTAAFVETHFTHQGRHRAEPGPAPAWLTRESADRQPGSYWRTQKHLVKHAGASTRKRQWAGTRRRAMMRWGLRWETQLGWN
jgi:hypothetical protein